jgi:hypothetical protein
MRVYKNIRLRKSPITKNRVTPINRIIRECLNESFERVIQTEFDIINEGNDIIIYRFKTNGGNYYDVEFIEDVVRCDGHILDGGVLGDYTETFMVGGRCLIPTVDVAFVPSEINISDRNNHELYTKETNRGELFELMGRISFLVDEFVNSNPEINNYVIGKNTKKTKLDIYKTMFNNIFSNQFTQLEGDNIGYDEGCYYFIKKRKL